MGYIRDDLKFGLQGEQTIKPVLETLFGTLHKTENKYDNFDFYNEKYRIELKTRNIVFGQYDSLIFDECKYDKFIELTDKNPKLQFFVVWNLRDGLFMWKMNRDENQHYIKSNFQVNRGSHIQTTRTMCIKNEFIGRFDDFERIVVKRKKKE